MRGSVAAAQGLVTRKSVCQMTFSHIFLYLKICLYNFYSLTKVKVDLQRKLNAKIMLMSIHAATIMGMSIKMDKWTVMNKVI